VLYEVFYTWGYWVKGSGLAAKSGGHLAPSHPVGHQPTAVSAHLALCHQALSWV